MNTFELDFADSIGWSALRWACYGQDKSTVEYLIQKEANVGLKDEAGDTTLIWALGKRGTYASHADLIILNEGSVRAENEILTTISNARPSDTYTIKKEKVKLYGEGSLQPALVYERHFLRQQTHQGKVRHAIPRRPRAIEDKCRDHRAFNW